MADLVIDACILKSAGHGTDNMSRTSRELLEAVFDADCYVVTSADLEKEWMKHAGKIALAWMAAMESRGKILHVVITAGREIGLLAAIDGLNESHRKCASKDAHLVLLSLQVFGLIVSHERASRGVFSMLSRTFDSLADVYWICPDLLLRHGVISGGLRTCPSTWGLSHSDCSSA